MTLFSNLKSNQTKPILIGVAQAQSSVGATHFCLALSTYLSQVEHRKTIVISMESSCSYEDLCFHCRGQISNQFSLQGVDFINGCTQNQLTQLYLQNYEILIIDFSVFHRAVENQFLSCNLRILLGSLVEWKEPGFARMLEQYHFLQDAQGIFLGLFASKDQCQRIRRKYGIRIHSIPYEPDPFMLLRNNLSFYDQIIHGRL